eukprot:TRINITY_DN3404_c0_g2_i6.p1 TRINITY_DN3404_c0_g2~~TRINITY_DN3404_c0_g2_i6.p1  ORF type:complete len:356 (-),score=42.62 TRINITY_DN3404_c0_g2_i6:12-1079(-)
MNPHLHAAFGGVEAVETKFWGSSTLLAILPPSIRPGPVMVSFTNSKLLTTDTDKPIIFTYKDESEKSLMELALQIVGIKLTGTVNDARLIAQSIINSSKYQTGTTKPTSAPRGSTTTTLQQRLLLSLRKLEHLPTEYPIQLFHKNGLGQTLLHLAARKGFLQLIRFLLPKATPAEINGRDNFGYTALHYACWAGQQNTVDSLMNHGAHVDLLSNSGITAMKLAEAGGFAKIIARLNGIIDSDTEVSSVPINPAEVITVETTSLVNTESSPNLSAEPPSDMNVIDIIEANSPPTDKKKYEDELDLYLFGKGKGSEAQNTVPENSITVCLATIKEHIDYTSTGVRVIFALGKKISQR